ncbi:MAG TPA: Rieske 2Fe-2S domain-containing protein [Acidimicrobiales bacterium]|nr:Rieske 2Fe-2S domain-containing protein [Acidimicrobiales bacterium]
MPVATVEDLLERIEKAEGLDRVARPLTTAVAKVVPHGPVKDALSGTWLGHPLHPLLTDVAIGSWTSAFLLDVFGGEATESAAAALVGAGVVSALPTAVAGLSDWSDLLGAERRMGLVHAAANVLAVTCYGLSWVARRKGDRSRGVALGLLGASIATVGGYLGGHLSYRQGVNVDRNAWREGPEGWIDVAAESELAEGRPVAADADGVRVCLVKQGTAVHAIADVCGHAGGPLHEGELDGEGRITCPWHGSTFKVQDGAVVHGPATAPQPDFEARLEDGRVSVRRRS